MALGSGRRSAWPRAVAVALAVALALVAPAAARPPPCPACAHGDALIEHFGLQALRSLAGELAALALGDPLGEAQYARIVELRRRTPVLARLGAVEDADLAAIAAAMCHAASGACVDATAHALRCLADRCAVALPPPDPRHADLVAIPDSCRAYGRRSRSPAYGFGIDWGNGWQRSRYPSDGHAWSLGIEGRLRFGRRLGAVARVDRSAGPDQGTDLNHDGRDDVATGSITRISVLAGPSLVLDNTTYDDTTRSLRLDLLGGYLSTRSQADESGPAAGADLGLQLWAVRLGVRVVQGFGAARDATMVLAHVGFLTGSSPTYRDARGCEVEPPSRSSRLALGVDLPLVGYGFSSQLGPAVPGLGFEVLWHLTHALDAVTHADLIEFPDDHHDRVIHQAVLAGVRIDHGPSHGSPRHGFFTTVMAGYTLGSGLIPTTSGSGPVGDISLGWGGESRDVAFDLRLHGRFGLDGADEDYRVVFLSGGFELRLDPESWRDRD